MRRRSSRPAAPSARGSPYDEKLVRDIFSRSGFTDGYLMNRNDGKMFGVRTEADAEATRAATPKARELFRRELQRVPVRYTVSGGVEDGGVKLTAADADDHKVSVYSADEPQPAQRTRCPALSAPSARRAARRSLWRG